MRSKRRGKDKKLRNSETEGRNGESTKEELANRTRRRCIASSDQLFIQPSREKLWRGAKGIRICVNHGVNKVGKNVGQQCPEKRGTTMK